jgi:hemolysin activation/secretion protein
MIAIQTKFLPCTNTKGARIKAWASGRPWSVTISYDYSGSDEMQHFRAVQALKEKHKLEWDLNNMRFGGVDNGYVFCFQNSIVSKSI